MNRTGRLGEFRSGPSARARRSTIWARGYEATTLADLQRAMGGITSGALAKDMSRLSGFIRVDDAVPCRHRALYNAVHGFARSSVPGSNGHSIDDTGVKGHHASWKEIRHPAKGDCGGGRRTCAGISSRHDSRHLIRPHLEAD